MDIYTHGYIHTHRYTHTKMYTNTQYTADVDPSPFTPVFFLPYICIHVYMYVYMYLCILVYIHVYLFLVYTLHTMSHHHTYYVTSSLYMYTCFLCTRSFSSGISMHVYTYVYMIDMWRIYERIYDTHIENRPFRALSRPASPCTHTHIHVCIHVIYVTYICTCIWCTKMLKENRTFCAVFASHFHARINVYKRIHVCIHDKYMTYICHIWCTKKFKGK